MTRPPELPRCHCGKQLTSLDVLRGFTSCSIPCAVLEQARRLDAMRTDEPCGDEVLDGLVRLKREGESKR